MFRGSQIEGYHWIPLQLSAIRDGCSLSDMLSQDPLSVSVEEDDMECFQLDFEDVSDLLNAFPASPIWILWPFSQEELCYRPSRRCRLSADSDVWLSADTSVADIIRHVIQHPLRRSLAYQRRSCRGSLGVPLRRLPKLRRLVLSSHGASAAGHVRARPRTPCRRKARRTVRPFHEKREQHILWNP